MIEIISPCIGVCQLGGDNICLGCLRTKDEIKQWGALDETGRRELLDILKQRRRHRGRIGAGERRPRRRRK